ncbi:protein translocase subunit SecD [Patescibacteria group bacterium]|nr:protein translocase subunit SecD [Patescibacteria group bacterium]
MKSHRKVFWFILALTFFSLFIDVPREFSVFGKKISMPKVSFNLGKKEISNEMDIKKGIDLAGGSHIVFKANMEDVLEEDRLVALEAAKENIERRINLFGLSESIVQTSLIGDSHRLIVELPGVTDVEQAVDLIGQTAKLDFRESPNQATDSSLLDFTKTGLEGSDLKKAQVQFDSNTGNPVIGLEFSAEGGKKFADITGRNIGLPVAIFLDEYPVTTPIVQDKITAGEAVISGDFDLESAKLLATQLNAGALPVSIEIIQERNIGATLGEESVRKSVQAGVIGLLMVILFMALYYGSNGILANIGLVIYGAITLMLYKLLPVTLTLPGIAGFLLSVGMAVDANILVFERMKEEIREGKPKRIAMELGFGRAWDSIRDANVCTLITCFILFNPFDWSFLNNSGMIRGFALTLGLGVLISLFTGIVVTRTLLRLFAAKEKIT